MITSASIFQFIGMPLPTREEIEHTLHPDCTWNRYALTLYCEGKEHNVSKAITTKEKGGATVFHRSFESLMSLRDKSDEEKDLWLIACVVLTVIGALGLGFAASMQSMPAVTISLLIGGLVVLAFGYYAYGQMRIWESKYRQVMGFFQEACADLRIFRFCTIYTADDWEDQDAATKIHAFEDRVRIKRELRAHLCDLMMVKEVRDLLAYPFTAADVDRLYERLLKVAERFNLNGGFSIKEQDAIKREAKERVAELANPSLATIERRRLAEKSAALTDRNRSVPADG